MRFRPCIDLHDGAVKQIVGATLSAQPGSLHTNFTADLPSSHYADLYRRDGLDGGHVIMLGPGNEAAASGALAAFPGEISRPPREWAERSYNVLRWTEMPRGGHFAALEEPQLLAEDVRAFFRPLRPN